MDLLGSQWLKWLCEGMCPVQWFYCKGWARSPATPCTQSPILFSVTVPKSCHPSRLPVLCLEWFLAIGNVIQACRNDSEPSSMLPLFAWWPGCATYILHGSLFALQWFSLRWCHLRHHSITAWCTRDGERVKHAGLMPHMWSLTGLQPGDKSGSWKQTCSCTIRGANRAGLVQETTHCDSWGKSSFARTPPPAPSVPFLKPEPKQLQQTCGFDCPVYVAEEFTQQRHDNCLLLYCAEVN